MTPEDNFPYKLSQHAKQRLTERKIELQWVIKTLAEPALVEPHPEDATCQCAYRAIPEVEGRILKVVYNTTTDPWRIVTVHFDRRMRGRL
ncbi:MAG: DUF4258 domain-containing protein [Cyanobacteria bacterium Co-bin8]|nr:DUF4258 domain-containing protein [Cyanobacteria bacterium Co-bin8]MBD2260042.1 DUF4258 domain-containing protein [Pseudanabaena sp. FACHB-2040]